LERKKKIDVDRELSKRRRRVKKRVKDILNSRRTKTIL